MVFRLVKEFSRNYEIPDSLLKLGIRALDRKSFHDVTKRLQKPVEEILTAAIEENRQRIKAEDPEKLGSAKRVRMKFENIGMYKPVVQRQCMVSGSLLYYFSMSVFNVCRAADSKRMMFCRI